MVAKKKPSPLSRHEQLRYNYLAQNSFYLDDKEREELAYLELKANIMTEDPLFDVAEEEAPQRLSRRQRHQAQMDLALPSLPSRSKTPAKPKKTKPQHQGTKRPKSKTGKKIKRGLATALACLLLVVLGMVAMFLKGMTEVTSGQTDLQPALVEVFNGQPTRDGVNILILGSDKRITEESVEARTDTVMVMNVNNSSGKIKLVSFMRDTLVNIEGYSSYPGAYDNKLNTAFTLGEQENNQGAELMRQTLKANFDIDISYYVMIDFETFALAVDTLFPNGVQMDAQFSTIEGEVVESVEVPDDLGENLSTGLYQTIAVGPQRMDGKTLLNYARFRGDDEGDNGRTRRQQEVVAAVLSQVKDPTKLFTGSEALGKVYALTSTNLSFPVVMSTGLSTMTSGQQGIERLTIPEQGDWVEDYDLYGGLGLLIDMEAYQQRLAELGLR